MPGEVAIAVESPLQDDIRSLIAELNAALLALTPPEFCSHMTVEQMAGPETTLWVARRGKVAVGCGALLRHSGGFGEVKRFYVRPSERGNGIAGAILSEVEAAAVAEGLTHLSLETGDRHPAAWRVYERGGFSRCGPFADYPDSKWSVFYTKPLRAGAQPAS